MKKTFLIIPCCMSYLFYFSFILVFMPVRAATCQGLTHIDSASIWPRHMYVELDKAPIAVRHVLTQSTKLEEIKVSEVDTITTEIYNLLVPANAIYNSVPNMKTSYGIELESSDTLLITLSILPNNKGKIEWQAINLDTISANHHLLPKALIFDGIKRLSLYRRAKNPPDHTVTTRINLFPIVQKDGKYWAPKSFVLTQYFLVRQRKTKLLNHIDYITINTKGPALRRSDSWQTRLALLPTNEKHLYTKLMPIGIVREDTYQGISQFWSRPLITISHPGIREFGIGEFEYKPGIGIVSGRNAHYFQEFTPFYSSIFFDHIVVDGNLVLR